MKTFIQVAALLGVVWAAAAEDKPCTLSGAQLTCNGRELTAVPAGIWTEISHLYLDTNSISKLYERSFTGFSNVFFLSINRNLLTDVQWEVFAELPLLRNLSLQYNKIHEIHPIPVGIIPNNLWSLRLHDNIINSLDPDVLLGAPNLESFYFSGNPYVVNGSSSILNHPNLRALGMERIEAKALSPASFSGLPKLEKVVLHDSGITNFTGMFVEMPFQYIDISGNEGITEVLAGDFYREEILHTLVLQSTALQKLEVSAVNGVVKSGGTIYISYTPLACSCNYEALYWWTVAKGVRLWAQCTSAACNFASRGAAHEE